MESRGHRKVREGRVCSAMGNKSIAVLIERRVRHPLLGKELRVSKKIHAHDENNEAKIGDVVRVMETRPVSKLKRWRLVEILSK
ncbi:MAG: 30S ribosomal protein S17 [Kiritimatiellales bacterium]